MMQALLIAKIFSENADGGLSAMVTLLNFGELQSVGKESCGKSQLVKEGQTGYL